jgi:hypothetical protein
MVVSIENIKTGNISHVAEGKTVHEWNKAPKSMCGIVGCGVMDIQGQLEVSKMVT